MIRGFNYATILVVLSVFLVPGATAADLSAEYLYGRWVIDKQNCSSPDSEYIEFNKNGTFEGMRTGKAEIVGFWGLKEGIIDLHMVTSPGFFDDLHKDLAEFGGIYSYLQGRMVIFNTQNKSFKAFGVIGDEIKRASAVRCP
ncbi:MAG: hypothetical protein WBM69_15610 [Desulfobacterales bacterium]